MLFALLVILFLMVRWEAQLDRKGVFQELPAVDVAPIDHTGDESLSLQPSLTRARREPGNEPGSY